MESRPGRCRADEKNNWAAGMWSLRNRYLETGQFLVCADYAPSGEMSVMNDWLTGKNVEEIRRGILAYF